MAKKKSVELPPPSALPILVIRGERVILDSDLARIYGVSTSRFNEAFKRNRKRFPEDFAFRLSAAEESALRAISTQLLSQHEDASNSSQIATSSTEPLETTEDTSNPARPRRGAAYRPWAFTEHGALMAANVLRSERAVEMSVFVVRAFVRLREQATANEVILKRLAEIDKTLLQHDQTLALLCNNVSRLLRTKRRNQQEKIGSNPGTRKSARFAAVDKVLLGYAVKHQMQGNPNVEIRGGGFMAE